MLLNVNLSLNQTLLTFCCMGNKFGWLRLILAIALWGVIFIYVYVYKLNKCRIGDTFRKNLVVLIIYIRCISWESSYLSNYNDSTLSSVYLPNCTSGSKINLTKNSAAPGHNYSDSISWFNPCGCKVSKIPIQKCFCFLKRSFFKAFFLVYWCLFLHVCWIYTCLG